MVNVLEVILRLLDANPDLSIPLAFEGPFVWPRGNFRTLTGSTTHPIPTFSCTLNHTVLARAFKGITSSLRPPLRMTQSPTRLLNVLPTTVVKQLYVRWYMNNTLLLRVMDLNVNEEGPM